MARSERSREWESLVIKALESKGQIDTAKDVGVSEPTITRLKNEHLANFCDMLDALGLQIAQQNCELVERKTMAALLHFNQLYLNSVDTDELLDD